MAKRKVVWTKTADPQLFVSSSFCVNLADTLN